MGLLFPPCASLDIYLNRISAAWCRNALLCFRHRNSIASGEPSAPCSLTPFSRSLLTALEKHRARRGHLLPLQGLTTASYALLPVLEPITQPRKDLPSCPASFLKNWAKRPRWVRFGKPCGHHEPRLPPKHSPSLGTWGAHAGPSALASSPRAGLALGWRCRWAGCAAASPASFSPKFPPAFLRNQCHIFPLPGLSRAGAAVDERAHVAHEAWLLHPPFPVGERYQRWLCLLYEPSSGLLGRSLSPLAAGHSSGSPGE